VVFEQGAVVHDVWRLTHSKVVGTKVVGVKVEAALEAKGQRRMRLE